MVIVSCLSRPDALLQCLSFSWEPPFTQDQWRVSNVIVLQSFSQRGGCFLLLRGWEEISFLVAAALKKGPGHLARYLLSVSYFNVNFFLFTDFDIKRPRRCPWCWIWFGDWNWSGRFSDSFHRHSVSDQADVLDHLKCFLLPALVQLVQVTINASISA